MLASAPAVLLGLVCLLLRAPLLAPAFTKSSANDARGFVSNLFFQAWGAFAAGVNHPVGFTVFGELSFLVFVWALLAIIDLRTMALAHRAIWLQQAFERFFDAIRILVTCWVLGVTYSLRRGSPPGSSLRHRRLRAASRVNYLAAAALGALWRMRTRVLLVNDRTLFSQALRLLTSEGFADTSEIAVWFFMLDLVGLTLLSVYFALLEDGPRAALGTMAGALLLGPAPAFAIYCAYRENAILKAVASAQEAEEAARAE
ncbi:hypothetical protein KFL_000250540 [Klebsormidium nitens]|uniref:Uncharacterized protein n=1 Tax=Klebsormidium nitens TaxID=105231 RepID=A0A1Y1HTL6_KLENI|nr:hypothetical protein KFL_000250540 [Klebsormidium nitens]|eukprot:GAQ79178.1 hypothetical protein KFL_000250540 [Klebsormidium nitens]